MKRYSVFVLVFAFMLMGCETMGDKTKKGAGIGALTGAAVGGIVGHQSGHGWQGALIGGAAGAVGGGLVGNQMDKKQQGPSSGHLSLTGIAEMAAGGASDEEIIRAINDSGSVYNLTAEAIQYLKDNGVSDTVINHMLSRR